MRRLSFILFTLLYVIPCFAQAKHPFTFEDMMKLKRVAEPVPSPDGKWVLFAVTDVDLAANTKTPHIWIVPLAGGPEREIIPDQDGDRPRWSPDGKRFAFISTKEGGSQVWVANFDGANGTVTGVNRLTSIATEAGGELWSPDGKNILFTSDVYPECDGTPADEAACNAKKLDDHEKSKVKALIFDHLLYRHWNAYKEGKRTHIFDVPVESGAPARDLTPGDFDSPVFSLGGQDNYAFSPDGQEICYTSNHDKVEATSTNNDLWIVPVSGGPAKNITADNPASDSTPLYSPDGKYIAYRAQQRPGYESDRFRLRLYDRKTRKSRSMTEKLDGWIGSFAWSSDSKQLNFVSEFQGIAPVEAFSVDRPYQSCITVDGDGGPDPCNFQSVERSGYNDDLTVVADGRNLLFTRMSIGAPTEIYRHFDACFEMNSKANCWRSDPLTHVNDAVLSQISMSALESFWFTGAENATVQGFLVKPPNFDANKKYPVKFLIHGGPQGAWGDDWSYRWNAELFAANGYVVVMVNPRGSTGYGQKFIDDINGDWGGRAFEDLMKGLDYAEQHYPFIDKDRECALGASYGGYAVNWILGHTNRFKCLVSHDGMFNTESAWGTTEELWFNEWEFKGTPYTNRETYRKWSPHLSATNFKTPTLVIHSQRDYRLDVSEGFQLFTTLQRQGVPSKMLYFPDEGHWILKPQNSQLWYKTVNDWVDQWLKK
ncbi:MAG TPA: S9 family peptidase [Terriglobales bacterium]|jgi:dipeptidyl aminopeptidase/acylaminoacyl peptidase